MSESAIKVGGPQGPLILPFELRDISGAAIREDHSHVAIRMQMGDGTRIVMGMTPAALDALLQTCKTIRESLDAVGVERTIDFKAVSTMQTGVHEVEGVAFVAMIIDRSLATATAYLMPPKAARATAKQLTAMARKASSARGEIYNAAEDPESACPGHVASADNPKVCGRCGVHIDSLRPPEEHPSAELADETPEQQAERLTKRAT